MIPPFRRIALAGVCVLVLFGGVGVAGDRRQSAAAERDTPAPGSEPRNGIETLLEDPSLAPWRVQSSPSIVGVWSQMAYPTSWGHTAIYDPVRDRMVVFGRRNESLFLYQMTPGRFVYREPRVDSTRPHRDAAPGRRSHTAIYDPVRDRMVVFETAGPR
jgi:hypothetical protein